MQLPYNTHMTQNKLADSNASPNNVVFHTGNAMEEPVLRISGDGFWVRGVKVPQDDKEAEAVYNAFKEWMTWSSLTRNH
jgi:hypothetical protein